MTHISTEWSSAAATAAVRGREGRRVGREGRRGGRGWGWGEAWRPGRPVAGWRRLQRGRRGRLRQVLRQPLSERKQKIETKNKKNFWVTLSVADPRCLARIPDFYPSRIPDPRSLIPDPKTETKERGEKISCHTFLSSHKFLKYRNYFSFKVVKKK
jgi:hypothetical protein